MISLSETNLIAPTKFTSAVLMGGTLPVIARWTTLIGSEPRRLTTKYYGWNTLGAVASGRLPFSFFPPLESDRATYKNCTGQDHEIACARIRSAQKVYRIKEYQQYEDHPGHDPCKIKKARFGHPLGRN